MKLHTKITIASHNGTGQHFFYEVVEIDGQIQSNTTVSEIELSHYKVLAELMHQLNQAIQTQLKLTKTK